MTESDSETDAPRPSPLKGLDVDAFLSDPARKQAYVTPMFELVAARYDEFTRLFSFGMDRRWKSLLIGLARVSAPRNARVVDLACGTGDLAVGLAHARSDVTVTGIDVSPRMLARARARCASGGLATATFSAGDMARLALAARSVDVVTAGYALRNAPSWRASLLELARVVRPGGALFTLDFYRPESRIWRAAFTRYLAVAGRVVGWWWHREPMAYGYIARSIAHFVSSREFASGLEDAGFRVVAVHERLGGGIAVHHGVRVD